MVVCWEVLLARPSFFRDQNFSFFRYEHCEVVNVSWNKLNVLVHLCLDNHL